MAASSRARTSSLPRVAHGPACSVCASISELFEWVGCKPAACGKTAIGGAPGNSALEELSLPRLNDFLGYAVIRAFGLAAHDPDPDLAVDLLVEQQFVCCGIVKLDLRLDHSGS